MSDQYGFTGMTKSYIFDCSVLLLVGIWSSDLDSDNDFMGISNWCDWSLDIAALSETKTQGSHREREEDLDRFKVN